MKVPHQVLITWLAVGAAASAGGVTSKKVLIIGVDGLGGGFLESINTPNYDALIAGGTVHYGFYNEGGLVPDPPEGYGASGANWSTFLTGAAAARHGVSNNSFSGDRFDQFPVFFKYAKDHDPSLFTASISNWNPINTNIVADAYSDLESTGDDNSVTQQVVDLLTNADPDVVFVHLDEVDGAGHTYGWGSSQYNAEVQDVDSQVGVIMNALSARPGVLDGTEDWLVLSSSDHGGEGTSHFASQGPINWEVPFVVHGPSADVGASMNRGSLRDVAVTALQHLGVDATALGLDGNVRGLSISPPNGLVGDLNQDSLLSGDGTGPADSDDVTAFVTGWGTAGHAGIAARYRHGDLNLDGETDLRDWSIFRREFPLGAAAAIEQIHATPEPSTWFLACMAASGAVCCFRRAACRPGACRPHAPVGIAPRPDAVP